MKFLIFLLASFYSIYAQAQKSILLPDISSVNYKVYDLAGSQLYIFIKDNPVFITKVGEYEFFVEKSIDSMINIDSSNSLFFLLKSVKYDYKIKMPRENYQRCNYLKISIFKQKYKRYYEVLYMRRGYENINFTSPDLEVNLNKSWGDKILNYGMNR